MKEKILANEFLDINEQNGITIIALIISIIIILILAVATINLINKEDILIKTKKATSYTEREEILENLVSMATFDSEGKIEVDKLIEKVEENYPKRYTWNNPKLTIQGKIDTYSYKITRTKIIKYSDSDNIELILKPIVGGIIVNVRANDEEIKRYYFSSDDGVTWSEPQNSGEYEFQFYDISETEYKIKVKLEDEEKNTKVIEKSGKTLQNNEYYISKKQILANIGGREFKKHNENGSLAVIMYRRNINSGNWMGPLLVSQDEDAVIYDTSRKGIS